MKLKNIISIFIIITVSILIGYSLRIPKKDIATSKFNDDLREWEQLPVYIRESMVQNALKYINWKNIPKSKAREILSKVLDASEIPHGDIAVPSETVHSKRYVISQWQRSAVGATIIILGKDKDGSICVALGAQRGFMKHPQGYMETALPKEDLTGLNIKGASRINSKTGDLVPIDRSIEDNAIREVYEEIGLKVSKEQLQLLSIDSNMNAIPVTIAANYLIRLPNTPLLQTNDDEFVDDDLAKPIWVKINGIKKDKDDKYMTNLSPLAIDPKTIEILNQALMKLNMKKL